MTFTAIPDSVLRLRVTRRRAWCGDLRETRRAFWRGIVLGAVLCAALLALAALVGCRPQYVQQPPGGSGGTGGSVATGDAVGAAGTVATGGATSAVCRWIPSGRAARPQSRITGGTLAPEGAYPWTCAIETDDGWQFCGATLVTPARALTAAHCQVSPGDVVHCATNDLRVGGVRATVREARNHYLWSGVSGGDDVAVLVLDVRLADVPVLALADVDPEAGTRVLAIGWGAQRAGGSTTPVLRQVWVPVVDWVDCNVRYGGALTLDMLCAGDPKVGADTCQGDSGGPLVVADAAGAWSQVGITSWGAECATAPGVYTSVAAERRWIDACVVMP